MLASLRSSSDPAVMSELFRREAVQILSAAAQLAAVGRFYDGLSS